MRDDQEHATEAPLGEALKGLAHRVTEWTGGSWAFGVALATIVVWRVTGPVFGFSDAWQLVINTGTTVVTFLMVFPIQRALQGAPAAVQPDCLARRITSGATSSAATARPARHRRHQLRQRKHALAGKEPARAGLADEPGRVAGHVRAGIADLGVPEERWIDARDLSGDLHGNGSSPRGRKPVTTMFAPAAATGTHRFAQRGVELLVPRGRERAGDEHGGKRQGQ